ncbi:MarR family transcriptional regulator [Streptomyces collinus]|uniref:MarR family transcriptional regulator n=1 Tax=Streptomyces collinus TaxID=42684 RepID=UPI002943A56C|nr:MarR family transcriptional regulator [Streptomyces collinus]
MSDVRDALGRVGHDRLAHALTACGPEEFTGELRVSGRPGGSFHLRGGLVVAAQSPGAPGPEALLLRSDRIDAERWAELVRESDGARWPAEALVAHGYAGVAQLRVVCVMALHDAAFAMAAGRVDGCERVAGTEPHAPVAVGEPPARLVQDAARKLAALATLPYPVRPDRERPRPAAPAGRPLTALQQELLTHADGRRTARDLAFRVGRAVYAVTVEVGRMLAEGFLECAAEPAEIPVRQTPWVRPVRDREPPAEPPPPPERPPPSGPPPAPVPPPSSVPPSGPDGPDDPDGSAGRVGPDGSPAVLPRREPGASGITEALAPVRPGANWRGFFRLRH